MDYILEPLDTDPDSILQEFVDYIQTYFPNWEQSEGQLDYMIARFFSLKIAVTADMASRVLRTIYRYFGSTVVGIQPINATFAQTTVTFTIIDNTIVHTLPMDSFVGIVDENGDNHIFATDSDVTHTVGATTLSVPVTAIEAGSPSNGLTGTVQLIEQQDWISNGTTAAPTSGGGDAETDAVYLDRMTANLGLMAPRPILGRDFALMAQNIPGIWRASSIDNYLPGPPPVTNAAMAVAVAAIDADGLAISPTLKTQLDDYLQSMRQQNFTVNVLDPQYSTIDVTYTAAKVLGADPADARTQVDAALRNYLNPSAWGVPTFPTEARAWINQPIVRYLELTTVVENVQAIDHVVSLTFSITAGGAQSTTDKTMPGAFPLPQTQVAPLGISGTVT